VVVHVEEEAQPFPKQQKHMNGVAAQHAPFVSRRIEHGAVQAVIHVDRPIDGVVVAYHACPFDAAPGEPRAHQREVDDVEKMDGAFQPERPCRLRLAPHAAFGEREVPHADVSAS
jgi:hypothetical protein